MIYSLSSVYAWECGTCTEVVSIPGKSPQSSPLKHMLPFSKSYQEISSSSTFGTLDVFRNCVWPRGGPNIYCFLVAAPHPPPPLSPMCLQGCEVVAYPKDWMS